METYGDITKSEKLTRTLFRALAGIRWRSADPDNMEFTARITHSQMDAITAALKEAHER
jgi:hypothetical protein